MMESKPKDLRQAVALAYQNGGKAPKVVASGKGLIAEQIIALAHENHVHVHESKEMVALLMGVELDQEIPPKLYQIVAELLSWLYKIEAAKPPSAKLPPKARS